MTLLARRSRAAVPVLALLGLTLAPTRARPQVSEAPDERVLGAWDLVPSEEEARRVVSRAVDETAEAMDFLVRGFARRRLRTGTPVQPRFELRREGDRVTVRFGDEGYTTALGRTEERRNPAGEVMRITQRIRSGGRLEQEFATDRGSRSYLYTPTANGGLRITTTTVSPHLPRPMVFSLEYRRSGGSTTNARRR